MHRSPAHPLSCDCAMCHHDRIVHKCDTCGMASKCDGRLRAHALDDALNGFYLSDRIFESALGAKCKQWRGK